MTGYDKKGQLCVALTNHEMAEMEAQRKEAEANALDRHATIIQASFRGRAARSQ